MNISHAVVLGSAWASKSIAIALVINKKIAWQKGLVGLLLSTQTTAWRLPKTMTKDNFDERENKLLGNQLKDENVISSERAVNVRSW